VIIRPIQTLAYLGDTTSIRNGIQKNTKKSGKLGKTQFAQP